MSELEELQAKHRKEQRDLQSRITQKKKSSTKKTRKGVVDECDRLQRELLEKQQSEIARLNGEPGVPVNGLDNLGLEDSLENAEESHDEPAKSLSAADSPTQGESTAQPPETSPRKKGNRQKARLARRAAEREAQAEKAADEAANETDHRGNERKIMDGILSRLSLKEIEIEPDGHCLYSAVANQLVESGVGLKPGKKVGEATSQVKNSMKKEGYRDVRAATAEFILANSDDFAPFLEEPIEKYARNIKLTTEWGGQLELQAIARAYGLHIKVIQGDGRTETFEPDASDGSDGEKTIWLAYYRHSYGLGEHYNALVK